MSHNQPHSWQSHHRLIMLEQLLHMKLFKDARWAGLTCGGLYPELEPACNSDRQLHGALLYRPDTRLCLIWWGLTSSCLLPGSVSGGVETILPPQIFTPSLRPSHLDALNINGKSEDSGWVRRGEGWQLNHGGSSLPLSSSLTLWAAVTTTYMM